MFFLFAFASLFAFTLAQDYADSLPVVLLRNGENAKVFLEEKAKTVSNLDIEEGNAADRALFVNNDKDNNAIAMVADLPLTTSEYTTFTTEYGVDPVQIPLVANSVSIIMNLNGLRAAGAINIQDSVSFSSKQIAALLCQNVFAAEALFPAGVTRTWRNILPTGTFAAGEGNTYFNVVAPASGSPINRVISRWLQTVTTTTGAAYCQNLVVSNNFAGLYFNRTEDEDLDVITRVVATPGSMGFVYDSNYEKYLTTIVSNPLPVSTGRAQLRNENDAVITQSARANAVFGSLEESFKVDVKFVNYPNYPTNNNFNVLSLVNQKVAPFINTKAVAAHREFYPLVTLSWLVIPRDLDLGLVDSVTVAIKLKNFLVSAVDYSDEISGYVFNPQVAQEYGMNALQLLQYGEEPITVTLPTK